MPGFTTEGASPVSPAETFAAIVDLSQWSSFKGRGPIPGIMSAVWTGKTHGPGARVRVENTDGSVHHEVFDEYVTGARLVIRMELGQPAARVLRSIVETVELRASANGTRIVRSFDLAPRFWFTWPIAWLMANVFLRRAVEAHNAWLAASLARSDRRRGTYEARDEGPVNP